MRGHLPTHPPVLAAQQGSHISQSLVNTIGSKVEESEARTEVLRLMWVGTPLAHHNSLDQRDLWPERGVSPWKESVRVLSGPFPATGDRSMLRCRMTSSNKPVTTLEVTR